MQIIVAWAEKTNLVPTGHHVMRDMNWFPEYRTEWEGKAAAWKWNGTEQDIQKARDYAKSDDLLTAENFAEADSFRERRTQELLNQ